jgi:surface protein
MPTIFSNESTTKTMIQSTNTTSANVMINYSIIGKQTTTAVSKRIPHYVKIPKITFSGYQQGTKPNLYVVLTNGIVPYVTTTFTIDPSVNYQYGITIPLITDGTLQNTLAKEATSEISFVVVSRPSEIPLTSIATQTGNTAWKLNHSIVILNNQSITIPTGHTLNATEYASIYNSGSIFLNGKITVDSTTRFINGVYGLIYGTGTIDHIGTAPPNTNRISLYNNFVAPMSVSNTVYSSYGLTVNSLGVYITLNNGVNTFPNNAVVTASSVVIVNAQTVTHATTESVGFDTLTHVIIQLGGIYRPYRISNAGIIINYGTIELQELITNHSQGIIINYGTIKPVDGFPNAYINNYGRIANASTGTISCNITNINNWGGGSFNYEVPIMNSATTSMAGITTTGKINGIIIGKPTITINTTIHPLDPTLDSDVALYCSNAVNGIISTTVNLNSGMLIQLSGSSNVDVNPPNITYPSTITVKTPITYRSNRTVNFTGPSPNSGTSFNKYTMYSSAGVFTVDTSTVGTFSFRMPQTITPTNLTNYENRVAIYANADKRTGFNPFSIVAETSIRDYTYLPTDKKVLYACAYNKGTGPVSDTSNTLQFGNNAIFVNITQTCTLDALDFGYIFECFRPNGHRAGFKPTGTSSLNPISQYYSFDIKVYNSSSPQDALATLTINTRKDFNAMYDSTAAAETNDGSLITIPFALNNTSLPTYVYNVTPMAADKLSFKIGDQIHILLTYYSAIPNSQGQVPWTVMTNSRPTTTILQSITTQPAGYTYKNDICCSLVCVFQGKEKAQDIIAANYGDEETPISNGTVISADTAGMLITGKTVLTGFLLNGFKIISTTTIPMCINIYKSIPPATRSIFFQVFFDYTEPLNSISSSPSSPLYIPFSYTEFNTIYTTSDESSNVSRIDATSLAFNGRQNPIFNTGELFYLEIITNVAYTYTYKTFRGIKTSGSLRGIIVPTQLIDLTSSGTLKYNGVASLPTNPYFLTTNPRGSNELFAIVNDASIPLLKAYATAIGKLQAIRTVPENNAVTAFTSGGSPVPFNNIVTTFVTNMDALFVNATTFNQAIGSWDTSAVTNMNNMFTNANTFNQAIGSWDTSKVTNMNSMFTNAVVFNQPIGSWNTANVTSINSIFYTAAKFNQPIGSWNTAKVTDMSYMFNYATEFNQPIGSWNTANVTDMSFMFYNVTNFNQPINYNSTTNTWNTANVKTMEYMLANTKFNSPIDSWNTSNVLSMVGMFYNNTLFNQAINRKEFVSNESRPISDSWHTGNVTNMSYMFSGALSFNQPINLWITDKVTSMRSMFAQAGAFNQAIRKNTLAYYANNRYLYFDCWDTKNVVDMTDMFGGAISFNQTLDTWNTSNVTNMYGMFSGATNFNGQIGFWNTSNVRNMFFMFNSAQSFNNGNTLNYDQYNLYRLEWNTSNVTDMAAMFQNARAFNVGVNSWNTSAVTTMSYMFIRAVTFNQPLDGWKYSLGNVRDMSGMFYEAKSFNQDISKWLLRTDLYAVNFNAYGVPIYYTNRPNTNRIDSSQYYA